ncbi:uncharacterized protein SOCE26_086000 [Sorangium cellulosum]|uniref:Uncharacterized protein n=1 Tax=Sorangium cellulosum TaxID=56 RepID=A0A2L0F671_SORCE|nr:uncharacterized protein SOCE26_086000 [Sorangium cellulosum]
MSPPVRRAEQKERPRGTVDRGAELMKEALDVLGLEAVFRVAAPQPARVPCA